MTSLDFSTLRRTAGNPQNDGQQMLAILDTMFQPREVVFSGTSLTIDESHRGAVIRFTSASAVTVTLPALGAGFAFSFLQYGVGTISFTGGTTLNGTGSAGQYQLGSCWLMSTGEWLVIGGA